MAQVNSTPGQSQQFGTVAVTASQQTPQDNNSLANIYCHNSQVLTTVSYSQCEPGVTIDKIRS